MTPNLNRYLAGLTISQGRHAGQPFTILPWQRRFVRGAFAADVTDAALAVARGNGKTVLIAGIAAAALDGPLAVPRGEVIVAASSFGQARITFEHVLAFMGDKLDDKLDDKRRFRVQDSANQASITDRLNGARVRVIGSDPRRAHGLAPVLVLADEPTQWPSTTRDQMLAALMTARGKVPDSRFIALGTRPADPDHWFARALAGGAGYAQCHAAAPDDPPFQKRTWRKANPSLAHMPDLLAAIRDEAGRAKRDASLLPSFRALRLNLGVADVDVQMLISASSWARCEADELPPREGPYVVGMDLGDGTSMSAAAAYWPRTGRLEALAAFPANPSLAERGLSDGVGRLYQDMSARGELLVTPGRAVDVELLLQETLSRWGRPGAVVADRYRESDLRQALDIARYPQADVAMRGQGFKDGAEDVRGFRRAILEDRVVVGKSLLLRSALSEARTVSDPAGNEKLSKGSQGGRRMRARDDAAAAAILAVAEGVRRGERPAARAPRFFVA